MKMVFLAIGLINLVGIAGILLAKENTGVKKQHEDDKEIDIDNLAVNLKRV